MVWSDDRPHYVKPDSPGPHLGRLPDGGTNRNYNSRMTGIFQRPISGALDALQVVAVRDGDPRLDAMLLVVEACTVAGTSMPPEVLEYFGDAWRQHGPRVAPLREAMRCVRWPLDGDALQSAGVVIWRAALPAGTTQLRILAPAAPGPAPQQDDPRDDDSGHNDEDTIEYIEGDLELETYFNTHGNPYAAAEHLYNSIANNSHHNHHGQLRRMFAGHPQFVIDIVPFYALENHDLAALETLHQIGLPLNVRGEAGEPLINAALRMGAESIVQFLHRIGVD